jgi:hypothetical protein
MLELPSRLWPSRPPSTPCSRARWSPSSPPTNLAPQPALCRPRWSVGTVLHRRPCLQRMSQLPNPRPCRVSACRQRRMCSSWRAEARSSPSSTSTARLWRVTHRRGTTRLHECVPPKTCPTWPTCSAKCQRSQWTTRYCPGLLLLVHWYHRLSHHTICQYAGRHSGRG